jgi:hypothetical protein
MSRYSSTVAIYAGSTSAMPTFGMRRFAALEWQAYP